MRRKLSFFIFVCLLLCVAESRLAAAQPASDLLGASDRLSLPIQITKGYIFVEGQALGQSGVFMFDTGTPFPFLLNNHALPLVLDHSLGTGSADSGQLLTLYRHQEVGPIRLAGTTLGAFGPLNSTDLAFLTHMNKGGIRPDILGFAGLPLVANHEFVLDYDAATIEVFRTSASGDALISHVEPQDVVAKLALEYQGKGLPSVALMVEGVAIEGRFDTGTQGTLTLTATARDALEKAGRLRPSGQGYVIEGLICQGVTLSFDTPALQTGARNSMLLGYNLLRHYRSVWNFQQKTLTLLQPRKNASASARL